MADELDLESGDEGRADEITAREKRRQARRQRSDRSSSDDAARSSKRTSGDDSSLRSRLVTALGKVADQLDARNDEELATAVREESTPMATGLVSVTATVKPLRFPLVILVELLEPVLAFARVGRILFNRWIERRQRRWDEAQAAEQTPEYGVMTNAG